MREVDKLYLIDQKVVFTEEGKSDIAVGSLEQSFDYMEHIKLNPEFIFDMLRHFDVEFRDISKYGEGRTTLIDTLRNEHNCLFFIKYSDVSAQIQKIEAEISSCGILNVRITFFDHVNHEETWVDEFSYSGRYEIWWKRAKHDQ